jgi:hypothetical protein
MGGERTCASRDSHRIPTSLLTYSTVLALLIDSIMHLMGKYHDSPRGSTQEEANSYVYIRNADFEREKRHHIKELTAEALVVTSW